MLARLTVGELTRVTDPESTPVTYPNVVAFSLNPNRLSPGLAPGPVGLATLLTLRSKPSRPVKAVAFPVAYCTTAPVPGWPLVAVAGTVKVTSPAQVGSVVTVPVVVTEHVVAE